MSHAIYVANASHPVIIQPASHHWRPSRGITPWFIVDTITDRVVDKYVPTAAVIRKRKAK